MRIELVLSTRPTTYEAAELTPDYLVIDGQPYWPNDSTPVRFVGSTAYWAVEAAINFGRVSAQSVDALKGGW